MPRPRLPKKEFSNNERSFESLLNGMASTLTNIVDYLEADRKETDKMLRNKRESDMSVEERKNKRSETMEDLMEDVKVLKSKVKTLMTKR